MIVGILRITVPEALRFEAVAILRSVAGQVLNQPGCEGFQVFEQREPESAVVLVEAWRSKADFEAHMRSDEYTHIQCAIRLSDCPAEPFLMSQRAVCR